MGLSIHYSGTIHRIDAIPQFVEELSDIAHSMGWEAQTINMGMIDQLASALHDAEPLPEGASLDDIVAKIEQIAKKLHEQTS